MHRVDPLSAAHIAITVYVVIVICLNLDEMYTAKVGLYLELKTELILSLLLTNSPEYDLLNKILKI